MNMKTCKFCHQEMAPEDKICPHCGKEQIDQETVTQEPAVEEPAVEEPAVEETPVQETPAEETSAEDAPAEEPSVEETPAEEPEKKEEKKDSSGKIAAAVAVILVLAAVLVALIMMAVKPEQSASEPTTPADILESAAPAETVAPTVPADGNPDDATAKGTYTVTDEELLGLLDQVVASAGDMELTNADLQVYYWMEVQAFLQQYGPYASAFGLNPAQSLDTQICPMAENGTWQQFFLSSALGTWRNYQSMAAEAKRSNHEPDEEIQKILDTMAEEMEKSALENGFQSADELLHFNVGAGAGLEEYLAYETARYLGYAYFNDVTKTFAPTEEEMEQYFTENEEALAASGITKDTYTVDVRHILIGVAPEDAENEEAWKAAEEKANAVLEKYLAGDKTSESFGELSKQHNEDPGSQANGGLYTGVMQGQMVPEFDAWCFDEARQDGDYGIVKTQFGYHIMYFAGRSPKLVWQQQAEQALVDQMIAKFMEDTAALYPIDVTYENIVLGAAPIFAQQ